MRPLFLLSLTLLLTACPPDLEVAPALLLVEDFSLSTTEGQGAPTTEITEVWAFADEEFIGVFPLPARIPLLRVGTVAIRLEAGIHQDGRSVTPDIYPFYTSFSSSIDVASGQTLDLGVLPIRYRDETVFGFIEDFEPGRGRTFTEILAGTGGIRPQTDVVRSGGAAGAVELGDSNRLAEIATGQTFTGLATVPINVWLEVDYRGDAPAVFGVIGEQNGIAVRVFDPGFLPRDNWTKIYFNLGPVIGSSGLEQLQVAISTLLGDERDRGTVYLDNLKLLYFPPQ
ncbi:hypothetical protein GGR28_001723 [Lewinella aquimaris]|uniref:Uncharacterized protein n=1 Tax=Neolewinella aquimaris TaxID=1835722 RepID=A0A840EDU2_9BACT|nr:hypothetical protein [Neolewinella aquimaris]MBB4079106.1 hypothetical protein [Neolewinella aquimaris]